MSPNPQQYTVMASSFANKYSSQKHDETVRMHELPAVGSCQFLRRAKGEFSLFPIQLLDKAYVMGSKEGSALIIIIRSCFH